MLNTQQPEKIVRDEGSTLAINSIFFTIQGEGPFAGRPAVFIRLAGCNLQCPLCDTEYTEREQLNLGQIAVKIFNEAGGCKAPLLIVITGGEPFRQNISQLVPMLLRYGFKVQIETNGTLYQELPYSRITIVCSPKTGKIHPKLAPHISALKYVVREGEIDTDGLPIKALDHPNTGTVAKALPNIPIYIQPADEGSAENAWRTKLNLKAAIEVVQKNNYILCIQTHKIIGVP